MPRVHIFMTLWIASKKKRARRSPQQSKVTHFLRNWPSSAGSRSMLPSIQLPCVGESLKPRWRKIAIPSRAADAKVFATKQNEFSSEYLYLRSQPPDFQGLTVLLLLAVLVHQTVQRYRVSFKGVRDHE